jgi:type III pantothenate kinase
MNLTIDQGNTLTKVGVFKENELISLLSFEIVELDDIKNLFSLYPITNTIISSVKNPKNELINLLKTSSKKFIELNHTTPLPIDNNYKTPETLGKDRIAAVVGAHYLQPHKNALIIDAGTAVTFDILTAEDKYIGGSISPGIQMRLKALHSFTKKLPLVEWQKDTPTIGTDTISAIWSGVVNGLVFEIDGYIDLHKKSYPDLFTFLTGGDAFFFESKLKNSIFAVENLVLTGLNRILNYNA